MEKKVQTEKANNAAEAAIDQNTVEQDKSLATSKQAEGQTAAAELKSAKDKLATDKQDLQDKQSKVSTLESDISSTKAQLESTPGDASLSANLQQQEANLVTANSDVTAAEGVVSAQESAVGQKQGSVDALKSQVKYKYVGNKPTAPTSEESELYRKFASEVGLPIPGDGSNPIIPPATNGEENGTSASEEDPTTVREKMQDLDAQAEATSPEL